MPVSPPAAGYKRSPVQFSEFFRTPGQFDRLGRDIVPKLLAQRPALQVWSAGCSYGAEPFSIALLLEGFAPGQRHYILATDVDERALARAEAADSFSERDVRNVPPELRRYFAEQGDRFVLDRSVASQVTFRQHDLLADPSPYTLPPTPYFDLVLCRNVMMYFTNEAKARLFDTLHHALRPGGYLFVGDAEVVNPIPAAGFTQELVGFYRKDVR